MYNFIMLNYTCYKFIFGTQTTVNENLPVYKTRDYTLNYRQENEKSANYSACSVQHRTLTKQDFTA